jgi:DNA modification methylase
LAHSTHGEKGFRETNRCFTSVESFLTARHPRHLLRRQSEQLAKLPDACVDLIYIDPPFNSNRNYEVFWGETREKRAFEDRHESTRAYIDYMRPRCVQLARVLKKTGSFYYHCDWHASHYVKVMPIFGGNNFKNEIL